MELKKEDPLWRRGSDECRIPDKAKTSGGGPPNFEFNNQKRKHHRRAKKGWKRRSADDEVYESQIKVQNPPPGRSAKSSTTTATMTTALPSTSKKFRKGGKKKQVYLRPTNGPLLKAPRNTSQFIIDDHENTDLFMSGPIKCSSSSRKNAKDKNEAEASSPPQSPDDDTFWAEYSERDFQSVYETAHQEVVSNWDKKKICDEIASLERRQKELVNVLARLDPDVYLQKLQSELATLQEENQALRVENNELNPALPDSSTNEDTTDTQLDNVEEEVSEEQIEAASPD